MLELAAAALTLGAVFVHSLGFDLFTIVLFAISSAFFGSIALRSKKGVLFSFLLGGAFAFGALVVQVDEHVVSSDVFGSRAFEGTVLSVDRKLMDTNLIVRDGVYNAKLQLFIHEKVNILPGDTVSIRARIEKPEAFITDTGRLFDYPHYLQSKDIVGIARDAKVILLRAGRFSFPRTAALVRFRIADIFSRHLSFPFDGIVAGMTVGYQGGLSDGIRDLFRNTGVLHVLVLSGYNITLLAGFLGILFRDLPFRLRTAMIIIAILMLVVISGSGVAAIRAGIMGSIAFAAGLAVRTYRPLRALTFAYLFFFFISPETIFSDPGFHLSFLATAFMILVLPKAQRMFAFIPKTRGIDIREFVTLACVVPLFMLPYTMYFSGIFPAVSPFSNILLSFASPLLMALGMALLAIFWIPSLAFIFGTVTSVIAQGVVAALHACTKIPLWITPKIPWWSVVLFYLLAAAVLFQKEIRQQFLQLRNSLAPAPSSSD